MRSKITSLGFVRGCLHLESTKADKGTCYFVQSFCPLTNSGSGRSKLSWGRMSGCIMTSTHVRANRLKRNTSRIF
jgi:hypothetical protein